MHRRTGSALPLPRRLARATVGVAVVVAGLTACGGDGEETDAASTTTSETSTSSSSSAATSSAAESPAAETQTLAVSSVDFSFEMAEDGLAAGAYEVTLTNEGGSTHDLVVERDGEDVAASEQIGPGESSTFEVDLEPGEYVFYCSVGNHRSMGMEITVQVT